MCFMYLMTSDYMNNRDESLQDESLVIRNGYEIKLDIERNPSLISKKRVIFYYQYA